MLTVRDVMVPEPLTVGAEDSLRSAADLLTSAGISGAPVVAGGRAIGVISLADLLAFEVERPGVPVFRPEQPEPFERDLFDEIPDGAGDGIGDAAGWFTTLWADSGAEVSTRMDNPDGPEWDPLDDHTVSEVMSRVLFHVAPATPVTDAARLMEKERVHRLLVLEQGVPVGILTAWDVVRAVARGELVPARADPALVL
jgi:CBS domain-containing protein